MFITLYNNKNSVQLWLLDYVVDSTCTAFYKSDPILNAMEPRQFRGTCGTSFHKVKNLFIVRMSAPYCNCFVGLGLGVSVSSEQGALMLGEPPLRCVGIVLPPDWLHCKVYTDVIIQNMYFMFDVYIDIPTYVTSSGILFVGLAVTCAVHLQLSDFMWCTHPICM